MNAKHKNGAATTETLILLKSKAELKIPKAIL